jgi:hypothetical protein
MRILILLWLLVTFAVPAHAQTVEEQLRAMQAELQALRAEVNELKQQARAVPIVQAQVAEFAQTKVESSTKFPVKIFGAIASNTFWNSNNTDWLDIPNLAAANNGGSFSSSLRQTRIGASIDGPKVGGFKSSGVVAMDFFGGISNFSTGQTMGIPRLLYAYVRLDGERTAFQIGQDHMILAPKNPTTLAGMAFPALYRSGNLYLRAPQLRTEQRIASGSAGELRATVGILAPIGGDLSAPALQFTPPNLAGERSRKPGVQARLSWRAEPAGPYEKPQWEFGASGHYSQEKYGATTVESHVWSADADATFGRIGVGGEFFNGRNVDAFGGAVGQAVAKSRGGFAELRVAATERLSFNSGIGTDRLYNWAALNSAFRNNTSAFGNAIYQFTPEFAGSLEYRRYRSGNSAGGTTSNNHFNLAFNYSF